MKRAWFLLLSVFWLFPFVLTPKCLAQSLKPGTEIKVRLLDRLNTGEAQAGQTFSACSLTGEFVSGEVRFLSRD